MGKYLHEGPVSDDVILKVINDRKNDLSAGASSLFLGKVRADVSDGKTVTAIEYSAYPEMVTSAGDRIIDEIRISYNDVRDITIIHSTGVVSAGEISLLISVTAGHRDEAARACREALEKIKESFPVWKKERFNDNTSAWKQE